MNSRLLKMFYQKPVAFNPLLARIANKTTAGLFLCQLLYWHKKGRDKKWVYKSAKEIRKETHLSRSEQETAIEIWKRLLVLEVEVKGVPPVKHFSVNVDTLISLMKTRCEEETQFQNPAIQIAENNKLNYRTTQNISESTPENTYRDYDLQSFENNQKKHNLPF